MDLLAEGAARSLFDKLVSEITSLEYLPNRNPTVSEPPYNLLQIKKMVIDNYVVFYKVNEKLKEVHILRVLNMRQHWQDYL